MGSSESSLAGGGGGKGMNKGPFTDAEYALVVQVFNSLRDGKTGRIPRAALARLFHIRTAPEFGEGLFRVFKSMPVFDDDGNIINQDPRRTDKDSLCFPEFFNGVSACSRASDRSILQAVHKAFDREGKGQLPYAEVKEMLRVAYQCLLLSRCACSPPPPPPSKQQQQKQGATPPPPAAVATPPSERQAGGGGGDGDDGGDGGVDLSFDAALFTHPIIREHDYDGAGLSSSSSMAGPAAPACALMTTGMASPHQQQQQQPQQQHDRRQHSHGFLKGDEEEEPVRFDEFYVWVAETFPLLYQCFGAFVYSRVCPGMPIPQQLRLQLPRLLSPSGVMTKQEELFALALSSGALQGTWERLYSSDENGMSFNRVCHHILGYRGPTAIVVRDTQGFVFGFYTAEAWKESNGFYGSSECFLFRLEPSFVEARPKVNASAKHYMYLNLKGFSLPHGLGVGGSIDGGFRLFIPESLEGCVAAAADGTFGYGPLAGSKHFDLEALEVWGVGGEERIREATVAQGKAREQVAENIAKARKVDKSKFVDNEFDKEMFLGKTFGLEGAGARDRSGRD